ncbi:hypothetical protein N7449_010042 [Penicillium cf. viridicatum]|uniref:Uncharacterized protein n=1 Tax=Penicillium cf. viridicatum TaxID=2972119 RepID=A0A9W9IXT5_9EURO|nr:hypothetical protein N7449_010042 [Penicillium cf. viridicatum]
MVLPPSGFVVMHHLQTFHGNPELGTRPNKEPCSVERAMELFKAWYENDKGFFTKKDLLVSRDLRREKVWLGDEHGLQGRFQQSVGQVVGGLGGPGHRHKVREF